MTPPTTSPSARSRATRVRAAALVAVAVLIPAASLPAGPARHTPLLNELRAVIFPSANPGYLPLVGTPPLRWRTPPPAPAPIAPPPVVLYTPPQPAPASSATEPPAATASTAAPPTTAETAPAPAQGEQKPPPLRPEDFLPYFQLYEGQSARGAATEGILFTPARPALPTSSAEFRQK